MAPAAVMREKGDESEAEALARLVTSSSPERWASSQPGGYDEAIRRKSLAAVKSLFDKSVASETDALPQLASLFNLLVGDSPASRRTTRSSTKRNADADENEGGRRSKKSRRGGDGTTNGWRGVDSRFHPLFQPTPLPSLVLEGMDEDQIWEQLELRGQKVGNAVESVLVTTGGMPDGGDEDPEFYSGSDDDEEDDDEEWEEGEMEIDLDNLDPDLIDPSVLEALYASVEDDDDDDEGEGEDDDEEDDIAEEEDD